MQYLEFQRHEAAVRAFQGDPCHPSLLMAQDGPLTVHYAPFEWVNPGARLVLVGITPGRVQAVNSLTEARRGLLAGWPVDHVLRAAKQTGAFSGAMRPNLVALLDQIGLQQWLQIPSCADLFAARADLLQTASALQFPAFVNGANYNGTPDLLATPMLRTMLVEHFGAMARALPEAVFLPLGPVPTKALRWLSSQGHVRQGRILEGLPHPSGANAERIAYFLGRKSREALSTKTDPAKLDQARDALRLAVRQLS